LGDWLQSKIKGFSCSALSQEFPVIVEIFITLYEPKSFWLGLIFQKNRAGIVSVYWNWKLAYQECSPRRQLRDKMRGKCTYNVFRASFKNIMVLSLYHKVGCQEGGEKKLP